MMCFKSFEEKLQDITCSEIHFGLLRRHVSVLRPEKPDKHSVIRKRRWTEFQVLQSRNPTNPFAILEPQNPWIDDFYVVQERHATDFKAPRL